MTAKEQTQSQTKLKYFTVQDIQKVFEEMTDDEEEIKKQSPRAQEMWTLKKLNRVSFKKFEAPPQSNKNFYKIGRLLGRGAFGKVNLAQHILTRQLVAIKSINKKYLKDEHSMKKINNETKILQSMLHSSVVKLFETFETEKHHLFVIEICAGGDLLSYVRKRRKVNDNLARYLFK